MTYLSRRLFLAASAGGSVALLHPICLRSAEHELEELSFVVVTDTHLGYQDREEAAKQWHATAAEIEACPGEFVLHLGDVVDGGREPQYAVYLAGRRQIKKPVHEIPGNHDPPELFAKHLRQSIDTVVDVEWLRCLLLNNAHTGDHDGFITAEQLAWIDRHCSEAARLKKFVLLCMHVPAHDNKHPDRGWHVKPEHGQKELYALVEKHRDRVLALFHGHFHNGLRGWQDRGAVHEVCFPSALYNLDRKLEAQKAPGYNPPEFRPGFTQVSIRKGEMLLRYRPVGVKDETEKRLELPK